MPEFVFDPSRGESYGETIDLKGNPQPNRDWAEIKSKTTGRKYRYTVAHWAATEARFRRHFKPLETTAGTIPLQELLLRVRQDDVIRRRVLDPEHFAYVPDYGAYIEVEAPDGKLRTLALSRQMVLFCIERRRAWRMLQSRAGIDNPDYRAQRSILEILESGELTETDLTESLCELFDGELAKVLASDNGSARVSPAPTA